MKPMQRSLFLTLKMMRSEGLRIGGRFARGKLYLFVARPDSDKRALGAKFNAEELAAAARWLETMVLRHHPRSAYAQLWRAIASSSSRR